MAVFVNQIGLDRAMPIHLDTGCFHIRTAELITTETAGPVKSKIITIGPFKKKFGDLCSRRQTMEISS